MSLVKEAAVACGLTNNFDITARTTAIPYTTLTSMVCLCLNISHIACIMCIYVCVCVGYFTFPIVIWDLSLCFLCCITLGGESEGGTRHCVITLPQLAEVLCEEWR